MSDVRTKADRLKVLLIEACEVGDLELAYSTAEELAEFIAENRVEPPKKQEKVPEWNTDPNWQDFCASLESLIRKIAKKFTTDDALRQDCEQEAREALYQIFPERKIKDWPRFQAGEIDEAAWNAKVLSYCKNTIRNAILSYLDSPKTGSWYIGRTRRVKNSQTGEREKVRVGARYSSLDDLVENQGLQVDEFGDISWERVSADGLPNEE